MRKVINHNTVVKPPFFDEEFMIRVGNIKDTNYNAILNGNAESRNLEFMAPVTSSLSIPVGPIMTNVPVDGSEDSVLRPLEKSPKLYTNIN